MEQLLLSKNKRLQDELTTIRLSFADEKNVRVEKEEQLNALQRELNQKRDLVRKLEEDLLKINAMKNGLDANGEAVPLSPIPQSPVEQHPLLPETSPSNSILPIIKAQRDRFRQKNAELEDVSAHTI